MSVTQTENGPQAVLDPMLPRTAVIREIQRETENVSTFWLELEDAEAAAAYRFQPGQFNMLYLPGFGEVAISISSDVAEPRLIGHTIRSAGSVTRGIARLQAGDKLGLRGPFGNPWPMEEVRGKSLLIVAGGIGLPPLRPVLMSILRNRSDYGRVLLLYGARKPGELLYTGEYQRWRGGQIESHITVDRADESWTGQVGVVPQLFYRIRLEHENTFVFICGPEIMMRFVIYEALARRIAKDAIFLSLERNMKCGIGLCGHCQFGPVFVCKQGPVLNYAAVEPFFGKEEF